MPGVIADPSSTYIMDNWGVKSFSVVAWRCVGYSKNIRRRRHLWFYWTNTGSSGRSKVVGANRIEYPGIRHRVNDVYYLVCIKWLMAASNAISMIRLEYCRKVLITQIELIGRSRIKAVDIVFYANFENLRRGPNLFTPLDQPIGELFE